MSTAPAFRIPSPPYYALVDENGQFPTYRRGTLPMWSSRERAENFLRDSDAPPAEIGELPTAPHLYEILTDVIQDAASFVSVDPLDDSGDHDGVIVPIQDVLLMLSTELPASQAL